MAHQNDSGAGDVRQGDTLDDAAAAFGEYLSQEGGEIEDDAEAEQADEEIDADGEGDPEPEADEDGEQEDEPDDEPAIEAPASLNTEERAAFAAASPEAQRAWAAAETRRNADVQKVTTRAAEAQRVAEATAAQAETEARRIYAAQVRQMADSYAPRQPNPNDYHDMAAFNRAHAQWQYADAQHQQMVQQIEGFETETSQREQQELSRAYQEDAQRVLSDLPELRDNGQMQELLQRLTPIAVDVLGYSMDRVSQAFPTDIRAMKRVEALKIKADKLDAINARKMQPVRAAKTAKPNAAQPKGSGATQRFNDSMTQLRKTGSIDAAAAAFANLDRRR